MKIVIFGGAFDPPHFGHIRLLSLACQKVQPDKVLVIPTGNAPHKTFHAPYENRMDMAGLAFPYYEIGDIENNPRISYTVDTLRELELIYRDDSPQFYLVVGEDSYNNIQSWKDSEQILGLSTVISGERDSKSSTNVRDRLYNGEDVRDTIPENIYWYIKKHGLYTVRPENRPESEQASEYTEQELIEKYEEGYSEEEMLEYYSEKEEELNEKEKELNEL